MANVVPNDVVRNWFPFRQWIVDTYPPKHPTRRVLSEDSVSILDVFDSVVRNEDWKQSWSQYKQQHNLN